MNFKLISNNIILFPSLLLTLVLLIFCPVKFDLSTDKRNSIQIQTQKIVETLDQNLVIDIYLGDTLPVELQYFKNYVSNFLDELKNFSKKSMLSYNFIDTKKLSDNEKRNFLKKCKTAKISPSIFSIKKKNKIMSKKLYPVAIAKYGTKDITFLIIKSSNITSLQELVKESINNFEYEIINAISKLKNKDKISVALLRDHGVPQDYYLQDFIDFLKENYKYNELYLSDNVANKDLNKNQLIIIAGAKERFTDDQLYLLDQYIMNKGRVMFFVDTLNIDPSQIYLGNNFGVALDTGLEDFLFKYGVSVNADIIEDYQCSKHPFITGTVGNQPTVELISWPFSPIIDHFTKHPISQGIKAINIQFASSMYASRNETNITHYPIAYTSQNTIKSLAPFCINLERLFLNSQNKKLYNNNYMPIACTIEGYFDSVFSAQLLLPTIADKKTMIPNCPGNKIFVASSSSLLKNPTNNKNEKVGPWGWDPFLKIQFDNQDFVDNAIKHMLDLNSFASLKNKKIHLSLINKSLAESYRITIQIIAIVFPLFVLCFFGLIWNFVHKRKWLKNL